MGDEGQLPAVRGAGSRSAAAHRSPDRSSDPDLDFDPNEIVTMARRRFWAIAGGFVTALSAVVIASLIWPKTYESAALLVVEPEDNTAEAEFLQGLVQTSQLETEIELMRSRKVVEGAVDALDLHVNALVDGVRRRPSDAFFQFEAGPEAQPGVFLIQERGRQIEVRDAEADTIIDQIGPMADGPRRVVAFAGVEATVGYVPEAGIVIETAPFVRAVDGARSSVSASRVQRDANLVQLRCQGPSPDSAHDLCEQVLNNYVRLRTELQRVGATTTADFLRGQVATLGQQLEAAENRLEAYRARNQIVALDERASGEVRQYIDAKAARDQLEAERTALAQIIATIRDAGETHAYRNIASFPAFLANDAVTQLVATLTNLETQRSNLVLRRSDENADVVALDARIAEVERQLLAFATSYLDALTAQVESMDRNLDDSGSRLAVIPNQQVTSARLEREVTQLQGLHSTLQMRLREAMVAEGVSLPSVRVVDQASIPLDPAAPSLKLNLALGFVFSIAFGLAIAFIQEIRDNTLRSREEIESKTGLPVLVQVPRLKGGRVVLPLPKLAPRRVEVGSLTENGPAATEPVSGSRALVRHSARLRYDNIRQVLQRSLGASSRPSKRGRLHIPPKKTSKATANGHSNDSFSLTEETQVALESFFNLATDLRLAARHWRDRGPVIAITSPGRGEGKTFACCNLGMVQAAQGTRTLVMDADMRARGISNFFGLSLREPGLIETLTGHGGLEHMWRGRLNRDDDELWVMPAGNADLSSGSLLEGEAFEQLLTRSRNEFGLTLVDTPPINVVADAVTVASMADAVMVVVRGGQTDRTALEMAMARLRRCGANVIGVLLNDVEVERRYYGGYHYEGLRQVDLTPAR